MAAIALVDKTENLAHGMDCPAFTRATVTKGTPPVPISQQLSAGRLMLSAGTVEFRDRSTGSLLASMSTNAGTVLEQSVAACRIVVTPADLQGLVRLEAVYPNGRTMNDAYGLPVTPGQVVPLSPSATDQLVKHGGQCPAFSYAVVTKGTAPSNGPQSAPFGEQPLQAGTITFRDRTTKATLATMSTLAGTRLSTPVAACEMVVGPDPRLESRVEVMLAIPS